MINYIKHIFTISFFTFSLIGQISIHDIQYTTTPGRDGYYPSPYNNVEITTGGIVVGTGFSGERYFISSSEGGEWNGLYIYDNNYSPSLGDSIVLTGTVYEYHGFTELKDIRSFEIISSGNMLPEPINIPTYELSEEEKYESVLIQLSDISVTEGFNEWSQWQVDDGSGSCIISNGFFDLEDYDFPISEGLFFESIKGLVAYSWGDFILNPRSIDDLDIGDGTFVVYTESKEYATGSFEVPIFLSTMGEIEVRNGYTITISYDDDIVQYAGYDINATLSDDGVVNVNSGLDFVELTFDGRFLLENNDVLIKLIFSGSDTGNTGITVDSVEINGEMVSNITSGMITISDSFIPIGDTLTLIQRPIQNIPTIILPGEEMEIICQYPEGSFDWQVELLFENITHPLELSSVSYNSITELWILKVTIPTPEIFELYDLRVAIPDLIDDTTSNAVALIPEEKEDYYFVHITDTHLPTHTFYSDNPEIAFNDTSDIINFRKVIDDINIINPEFVLLTGDLVNEGELEDFENARCYTKAQRILSELEVPVFLVAGNHDLGGWNDTPPPQGTSRRNWWRFFGWKWLQDPPENVTHTQDYSFEYSQTKFIGMESYDNYDRYMYSVYGRESFTSEQINWLRDELNDTEDIISKVLFYHNDFSNQINLRNLDVDMALWGHIHSNEGSIYNNPFNLSTDNICDGDCAYRIIKMYNAQPDPKSTCYADYGGDRLTLNFTPSNNATSDSVTATLTNNQNITFENTQIKFVMPYDSSGYEVDTGQIEQFYREGNSLIYYVTTILASNSTQKITIKPALTSIDTSDTTTPVEDPEYNLRIYPNPFFESSTISFKVLEDSQVEISIYNLLGLKVKDLLNENMSQGFHNAFWNGTNSEGNLVKSGIYHCRINIGKKKRQEKIIYMR